MHKLYRAHGKDVFHDGENAFNLPPHGGPRALQPPPSRAPPRARLELDAGALWQGRDLLAAARTEWGVTPAHARLELRPLNPRLHAESARGTRELAPEASLHAMELLTRYADAAGALTVTVVPTPPPGQFWSTLPPLNLQRNADAEDDAVLRDYCLRVLAAATNSTAVWDRREVKRVLWARSVEPPEPIWRLTDAEPNGSGRPPRRHDQPTQVVAAAEVAVAFGDGGTFALTQASEVVYALIDTVGGRVLQRMSHPMLGSRPANDEGFSAFVVGGGQRPRRVMEFEEARDKLDFMVYEPHNGLAPVVARRDEYDSTSLKLVALEQKERRSIVEMIPANQHPEYVRYFHLQKMGIMDKHIQTQMRKDGVDDSILKHPARPLPTGGFTTEGECARS